MCDMYNMPVAYNGDEDPTESHWDDESVQDRVILETEITLRTGPNITMKIHEESRSDSVISGTVDSEEDSKVQGIVKVLNEDSESDYYEEIRKTPKTPRKVRFGGESVKLRTPESDTSHHGGSTDQDVSTIKITVTDALSIKTRRSLIPVRISSLPSTPQKMPYQKTARSHKSAPNLTTGSSKIPLRKKSFKSPNYSSPLNNPEVAVSINIENSTGELRNEDAGTKKETLEKSSTSAPLKLSPRNHRKLNDGFLSKPVHNEIELFHNLTRSPEGSRKNTPRQISLDEAEKSDTFLDVSINNNNNNSLIKRAPVEQSASKIGENNNNNNIKGDYNSFTVYEPMEISEDIEEIEKDKLYVATTIKPTLQQSLSSFTSEDELWAKSEALESLVQMLKQPGTCETLEAGPAALLLEALFACHHRDRLHTLADDALTILVGGLREDVLEQCLPRICLGICKMGSSSGVRLALTTMKRLPPKKIQYEVLGKGFGHRTREGALQVLMACARLYPSADVETEKIAEFASFALKDRRRRVRQAALETLAVAAQLKSPTQILDIVQTTIHDFPDSEDILQIARTRLSRKQLPTVDLDGTVRYTSPTDQIEIDWISGSLYKSKPIPSPPLSSASSSSASVNYWMNNSRHEVAASKSFDDEVITDPNKIWAIDGDANSKNEKSFKGQKGVLRPIYILESDLSSVDHGRNGNHRPHDRGRSFSPPKHHRGQYQTGVVEAIPVLPHVGATNTFGQHLNLGRADTNPRLQYPESGYFRHHGGGFRKSFSSDQLYFGERLPYSYSLSSRSSSTSTGSSTKSGFWHRDIRSGIPIPISSDIKLKIKHASSNGSSSGPVIAKRSVVATPQTNTPVSIRKTPRNGPQESESPLHRILPPPKSSGSESSGYYTPTPPENHQPAFIKMDTEERLSSDVEEPELPNILPVNNNSLHCTDSFSAQPSPEHILKPPDNDTRNTSTVSSIDTSDGLGEVINSKFPSLETINVSDNAEEILEAISTSSNIVITDSTVSTIQVRRKSKSVIDLQNILPEINSIRKNINSAPVRNDENILKQHSHLYGNVVSSPSVIPLVSLNSMDYSLQLPVEEVPSPNIVAKSKLERRFSRNSTRRSTKATPRLPPDSTLNRPFIKPKEALQHALTQMESPDWEITLQGLQGLSKIARFNPEIIEHQIHQVCLGLAKHVKNLRSQVARIACTTASELFLTCRRGLDVELEELAAPLLHRTADTNRFLRADANAALNAMCEQLPVHRVIPVITLRGCAHQNAVVRAASVRLLGDVVKRIGPDRALQLPKELRDKLLLAGANSLTDGNLEARSYGKALFKDLIGHHNFQKCLHEAVPQNILRHIAKVLVSIKIGS